MAGVFAWLGQWQLERAIDTDPPRRGATEEVLPLEEVVEPGEYLAEPLVGQRVTVTGTWVPGRFPGRVVAVQRRRRGLLGHRAAARRGGRLEPHVDRRRDRLGAHLGGGGRRGRSGCPRHADPGAGIPSR